MECQPDLLHIVDVGGYLQVWNGCSHCTVSHQCTKTTFPSHTGHVVELQFVVIVKTHTRLKWYCNQLNKEQHLVLPIHWRVIDDRFQFPKAASHTGQEHLQTPHLVRQINTLLISNKKAPSRPLEMENF